MMRQLPRPGEIFKHFKGNCYRIITIAAHEETGEKLVIYQALYGSYGVYARELSVFMSPVDREKYPDAEQKMRFELVESGAAALVQHKADVQSRSEAAADKTDEDKKHSPKKEAEPQIDPMVLAYLDADTCKEKLQILTTMKDRLTDQMINTMAIAIDVDVKPGDITERYEELKYCLAMRERFEVRRLR
ncbi:MAG: DUF1653 domain-containing protein [Lachnospiraceae bacterium]|nr:DUF1653 domain-containing protein [Lachnospiraceae bacterium]